MLRSIKQRLHRQYMKYKTTLYKIVKDERETIRRKESLVESRTELQSFRQKDAIGKDKRR